MIGRELIIIGQGPVRAIAEAIARKTRVRGTFRVYELPPDMIASTDLAFLGRQVPASIEIFAAVGVHALNHARSDLLQKLRDRGYPATSLIDPTAVIDSTAQVGENCLVAEHCSVGPAASVGMGSILLAGSRIEASATVDAFAWIGANSTVGAGARVGEHTVIRSGVHIDATVPIGAHCEIAIGGIYQSAIPEKTYLSSQFSSPVRVYKAMRH